MLDLLRRQSVRLKLARDKIAPRDLQLLLRRVAGQRDDLHPVAQGAGDRVEHVRGGDEGHPREVEGHGQVIVAERRVLLGVEHLQHRGGRIALETAPHFVDFVEHHHAVARARLLDRLDDVSGQRPDIGAPVPADFGLVMDAAEADPHERTLHRPGDGLAQRRLAHAGRPGEAEDRRFALRRELAHREILDDPLLDLFQAEMVLLKNAARLRDVDRLFFRQRPGQLHHRIDVGANHSRLAGLLRHALIAAQLLADLRLHLGRHVRLRDRLVQLGDLRRLPVAFAKLPLDGRHLLAEHGLALALIENGLGLASDFLADAQDLDPFRQKPRNLVHAQRQVQGLQDLLLLLRGDIHVGGRQVRQRGSRLRVLHRGHKLGGHLGQKLQRLDGLLPQEHRASLDLRAVHRWLGEPEHVGDQERPFLRELRDAEALDALDDGMVAAVGSRHVAHDIGDGADAMHVGARGLLRPRRRAA